MQPIDPHHVEQARNVLTRIRPHWITRPGVTGIDVGLRERQGELVDEIAIRVYVAEKRPRDTLASTDLFPESEAGVPVDIIEFEPPSGLSD